MPSGVTAPLAIASGNPGRRLGSERRPGRGGPSPPSSPTSKAVSRWPSVSATTSVPPGVITNPLGKCTPSATRVAAPSGIHADDAGGADGRAVVVAELADPGAARSVDDHVVARAARERGQIRHLGEPFGVEPQQPPVEHGHDEHPPVGVEPQPRGLALDLADRRDGPVGLHRLHPQRVEVGEEQPPVAPQRALGEHEAARDVLEGHVARKSSTSGATTSSRSTCGTCPAPGTISTRASASRSANSAA